MRKPLIAGNWKMNGTQSFIEMLLDEVVNGIEATSAVEWAVFPPFTYLSLVRSHLLPTSIVWGAQNVSHQLAGAFTGEVAADMLVDLGCTYVIVGHSERRQYQQESNALIAEKFYCAYQAGLKPILCVGETRGERDAGKTLQIIKEQLDAVLTFKDNWHAFPDAVIAYEPVWAIGTGHTPTADEAQHVHRAIRDQLGEMSATVAEGVRLLYGGSVKPENAGLFLEKKDIDGALIGGASLKAELFLEIGRRCNPSF